MRTSIHTANPPARVPAPKTIDTVRRRINCRWTPAERRCRLLLALAKQFLLCEQLCGR